MKSRVPLILAIILLLLPVLYVGSYLALVTPGPGRLAMTASGECKEQTDYRLYSEVCRKLYWPLEHVDRKVRPGAWSDTQIQTRVADSEDYFHAALTTEAMANNPGVALVEQILPGEPAIVHIRDWHYVPKELYGEAERLSGAALDEAHANLVQQISAVHKSQLLILADAPEVWQEGLTEQNEPAVATELASLAAFHVLLRRDGINDPEHEERLLRLGAGAELILDGREITLLPADDHKTHEAARPREGKIDDTANRAREQSIVRRIVAKGKTTALVLGGDHDLTEAIKPTGWGYVRVTPKGYPPDVERSDQSLSSPLSVDPEPKQEGQSQVK